MFKPTITLAGILAAAAAITMTLGLAGSAAASTPTAPTAPTAHIAQSQFAVRPVGAKVGEIDAPDIPVVINHSSQLIVITTLTVNRGSETAYWVGQGPAVGLLIPAGSALYVTWEERFNSEIDLTYQSTDLSTFSTSTGFSYFGGWGYGCNVTAGTTLKCDDNGTNPTDWDQNVTIDNA